MDGRAKKETARRRRLFGARRLLARVGGGGERSLKCGPARRVGLTAAKLSGAGNGSLRSTAIFHHDWLDATLKRDASAR